MTTIGIPFTEEVYGLIIKEAKLKNIQPEALLKIWILERAKTELSKIDEQTQKDPMGNILAFPLKVSLILTASATATIRTLAEELTK